MERLGAIDEGFFDIEDSGPPVAVGTALKIDGSAPTVAKLRQFFAARITSMPRFRQRFEDSRSKVLRGKWVDASPDLTHHVRHRKIKSESEFSGLVAEVIQSQLDPERPLWDATMITGYSSTEWALLVRLHHAIADGQGATILLGQLIDFDPTGQVRLADGIAAMVTPRESAPSDLASDGLEAATAKAAHAVEKSFRMTGQFISTLPDTIRSAMMFLPRKQEGDLTGPLSDTRVWHGSRYSLSEVKQAKRSLKGVTVNDIVMAAVAVGFTDLLDARGEDSEGRVLRTVIPVSLRQNLDANNQVSLLPVPLPLGDIDPLERIKSIKKSTKYSKNSTLPIMGDQLVKVSENLLPAPVQEAVLSRVATTSGYFSETLVTNVPGPRVPLFVMGSEVLSSAPMMPLGAHFRIIIGITSFKDDLNIGITGDGEHARDIDVLAAGIARGFDQIVAAAAEKRSTAKQVEVAAAVKAAGTRVAAERATTKSS